MATDSQIHENLAEVVALNHVGGEENTPRWEGTHAVPFLDIGLGGISDDRHHGHTRTVRSYQIGSAWSGRRVRNERQVSVATLEDLETIVDGLEIAPRLMDLELDLARFMSEALAVNVVIKGAADLKQYLGPGTKLMCGEPSTGAIIDISEAHLPCKKPALVIARALSLDHERLKSGFKTIAAERRGYMAGVYSPGRICLNDSVAVQLPIDLRETIPDWRP